MSAARELFRYVIALADSGRMIGETGLYPRIGPDALEAGYLVDRREAGRGYAAEAASAMVRIAFEVERVHPQPPEQLGQAARGEDQVDVVARQQRAQEVLLEVA